MQAYEVQVGARVALIQGHVQGDWDRQQHLGNAPVLTVVRQLADEPDMFETSDGQLRRASELHKVVEPEPPAA
jgi:hypothetical protein